MEHIEELVKGRRSVRTFDGNRVSPEDLKKLTAFAERIENPYGIPVEFKLLDGKGFVSEAVGDMQKIDMGIALCHFALAAEEKGLKIQFSAGDLGIAAEAGTEYIASYLLPQ